MTESKWLNCSNPRQILDFLDGKVSDRKLRLFAAACCRVVWPLLIDVRSRDAVEVVERFADGAATVDELSEASFAAFGPYEERLLGTTPVGSAASAAYGLTRTARVRSVGRWMRFDSTRRAVIRVLKTVVDAGADRATLASLLRDVVGNPFRPPRIDPAVMLRNGGGVPHLARGAYDIRDLPSGTIDRGRLAMLADALEDAGCTDAELLGHLRGPGMHFRGCWAVDLLLGRS